MSQQSRHVLFMLLVNVFCFSSLTLFAEEVVPVVEEVIIEPAAPVVVPFKSFKKDQIQFDLPNSAIRIDNKLRFDLAYFSKNTALLNDANHGLDQTFVPGKFTLDTVFIHEYFNPVCEWNSVTLRAAIRFKGTFGAPESAFRVGFSPIKDLDAVIGTHTHPININIPVLRELRADFMLNDVLGLSFDHEHLFTVGFFPFSLGRGIALGDAYTVTPDLLGYDPANAIEQYAPGFKISGSFLDDHVLDYDAYGAILDNLSDSFNNVNLKTQGQFYGHRFNQARGFGVFNYILAGRLKWLPVDDGCKRIYIEPYALYNHDKDQKIEVSGDASTKLGTLGFAMEVRSGNWEFGCDTATNVGKQYVKGLDRNAVVKVLRPGMYNTTQAGDASVGTFNNSHVVLLDGKTQVGFNANPPLQAAIEAPIESATPCSTLSDLNGKIIPGVGIADTPNLAVLRVQNAADRFRDPYVNELRGSMFVADMAYKIRPCLKLAGTVGYATGDENPNRDLDSLGSSEIDGEYTGFISLQELYSGGLVRSAFLLSGKGSVPRVLSFPSTEGAPGVDAPRSQFPSTVSRFTNIAFVGASLWYEADTCTRKWFINPNILTFWVTHPSHLPAVRPPIFNCDGTECHPVHRECARQHLGTELNIFIDGQLQPGLKCFLVSGLFVPGGFYEDIKGLPLNKAEQRFLNSVNRTGETTEFVPTLGTDPAFFINFGIEYLF